MTDDATQSKATEFTEKFWNLIDEHMGCRVPSYVKNILRLRGFDNAACIKTLTDEDYKEFETFARTKMAKFIPSGSNLKDYYHVFSEEPNEFEFLPGHIRLLKEIAKYITVMTASHDPTFFDPDSMLEKTVHHPSTRRSQELLKLNDGKPNIRTLEICGGDTYSISGVDNTLQSNTNAQANDKVASKMFRALIVGGSPKLFSIQFENNLSELNQMCVSLEAAATWPKLVKIVVGRMCAALFVDGSYYRAKILSLYHKGLLVVAMSCLPI